MGSLLSIVFGIMFTSADALNDIRDEICQLKLLIEKLLDKIDYCFRNQRIVCDYCGRSFFGNDSKIEICNKCGITVFCYVCQDMNPCSCQ